MAITFSADEIFEIAEQIEKIAANFYKEAAERAKDKEMKEMFREFSVMEGSHAEKFANMRRELSERDLMRTYDPLGEAVLYLKAFAEANGWEGKINQRDEFTGQETSEQILNSALRAEKDSVTFYVGMKDMVARETGKKQVEKIINEEMKHIASISEKLVALRK